MLHSGLGFSQIWPMMVNTACPGLNFTTRTARAMQIPIDERDGQHWSDGGAIIYIFPVDSVADADEAAFWVYFTPVGHHSVGNNQLGSVYTRQYALAAAGPWPDGHRSRRRGRQRNSVNRNTVLIAQIGSVEGAQAAAGIAVTRPGASDLPRRAGSGEQGGRKLRHPGGRREGGREGQQ